MMMVTTTASLLEGLGTMRVNPLSNLLSSGLVALDKFAGVVAREARCKGKGTNDDVGRHIWFVDH